MGAAIGAAIGHQYDMNQEARRPAPGEQFFVSTFRTMGHVAKADGRVTEREIAAARSVMQSLRLDRRAGAGRDRAVFRRQATGLRSGAEMAALRASCQSQPEILRRVRRNPAAFRAGRQRHDRRRAHAGGECCLAAGHYAAAVRAHRSGAARRGASTAAASWITPRARPQHTARWKSTPPSANEALTRAYRRLMSRHHPDKLKANGLPDSMLEHAKQRTQAIREAYELLKDAREATAASAGLA